MNAQQALPNLTLKQKILGGLGLVGFGVVAFATAGIVFTIMAAVLLVSSIAIAGRWLWCKVTGKSFLPGVDRIRQQMEQMQRPFSERPGYGETTSSSCNRKNRTTASTHTIEGEYHRVDEES